MTRAKAAGKGVCKCGDPFERHNKMHGYCQAYNFKSCHECPCTCYRPRRKAAGRRGSK